MRRRDFLRRGALLAGAATLIPMAGRVDALAETLAPAIGRLGSHPVTRTTARTTARTAPSPLLASPASECPIDTVVVLMLENRSFDHFLGWLGHDAAYLEAGKRRWGSSFAIEARQHLHYAAPSGHLVATEQITARPEDPNPARICTGPAPAHGWYAGRVQRDHGFLAAGSGNQESAVGYYVADDLPVHAALARRFTVNDHHFASVMGPMDPYIRVLDRYFEDCANGTLPNFTFVAPAFSGPFRTDDHPRGCVNIGERFLLETFGALVQSPQWERSLFVLCFDEWGGFFDHVTPPHLTDQRASAADRNDFSQAGFRVPSIVASPYARPGFVDSSVYDHTSILRFLHWRFLGAPAEGPGANRRGKLPAWALTSRDHDAQNIGRSLWTRKDPEADAFRLSSEMQALTDRLYPAPTLTPWLD